MQAWQATVQDDRGNAVPNPVVTVYQEDGVTLASIFNEAEAPLPNPLTGGIDGFVKFYAEPGFYKVEVAGGEVWDVKLDDVLATEALDLAQQAFDLAESAYDSVEPLSNARFIFEDVDSIVSDDRSYDNGDVLFAIKEGWSFQVIPSDGDRTTAGGVQLRALPTSSGTLRPEQFGAAGDGVADDTAAFRRMLSRSTRRFEPDAEARYHITGQLDFGRRSEWVTPLRLRVTGSRDAPGASLEVQTGGGSQHLTVLFAQGDHSGPALDVMVETAVTAPWLAIVGNDFYLHTDGTRPGYTTDFDFDKVDIEATSYSTGYTGDGNASIRFQGMDKVSIGSLSVNNFQFVCRTSDVTDAVIGAKIVNLDNFRSGIQITRSVRAAVGNVFAQGSTALKEYVPGANALVVRACVDFVCGDVAAYDMGEHGIRVTSAFATTGSGIWAQDVFTRASFGNLRIYRPGGCGFKVASGDSDEAGQPQIDLVRIGTLYVEDAGMQDYDTGGTFTGANHFGLNLQRVETFACSSYITRRVNALHNGRNCALIRTCKNFFLGTMQAGGCYGDLLFWNAAETSYNIEIGAGFGYDYGRGGEGRLLHFFNPARMGRVKINLDAHNGPQMIRFAGDATGTPVSMWNIRSTYFNVTDISVVGATEVRSRVEVRSSSSPSASGETVFGVNDMLLCKGEAGSNSTLRNGLCAVYIDSTQTRSYVAVADGQTPSSAVGDRLPGAWRARGQSPDAALVFVQKVAM